MNMYKSHFEIINRSELISGLMDGDELLYVVYRFRGHVFRCQDGKITAADEEDKRIASARK